MQVNSSNFAQTYQSIKHHQNALNNSERAIPSNEWQQAQHDANQPSRSVITQAIDYSQPQRNLDTYTNAYQNASGDSSSSDSSSNHLDYQELQDINQAVTRHQVLQSGILNDLAEYKDHAPIPTPYYQSESFNQVQAGSMINTYA